MPLKTEQADLILLSYEIKVVIGNFYGVGFC